MARWYYYPTDKAPLFERIRNRLFRKPVPDFPKTVVIETQYGCNAKCVFCQYSQLKDELPRGKMTQELVEKIAQECAGRNVERFILCLDNEPLMDKNLTERYAVLKKHCPGTIRNLTTNASLLTPEKVDQLIGSGLVDEVFLSINGDTKEIYEKTMVLPYDHVFKNLNYFCKWLRENPQVRQKLRVRVNTVRTTMTAPEIPAIRKRWEAEGFEVHVIAMDNRGAQLDMSKLAHEQMRSYRFCRRPFHTMVITWEGVAVLCCVDYKRDVKVGNLFEETVYSIWNGTRMTQLRHEYLANDFTNLKICETCQVQC